MSKDFDFKTSRLKADIYLILNSISNYKSHKNDSKNMHT